MCELFNLVKWDVVESTSLQQNFPYRSRSTYTLCSCLIFKMSDNVDDFMERRWIRDEDEAGVHDVVVETSVWHLLSNKTQSRNTFRRYDVFTYVLSIQLYIEDELTNSIRPVINVNSEFPLIWRLSYGMSSRRRSAISSCICSNRSLCCWVSYSFHDNVMFSDDQYRSVTEIKSIVVVKIRLITTEHSEELMIRLKKRSQIFCIDTLIFFSSSDVT